MYAVQINFEIVMFQAPIQPKLRFLVITPPVFDFSLGSS